MEITCRDCGQMFPWEVGMLKRCDECLAIRTENLAKQRIRAKLVKEMKDGEAKANGPEVQQAKLPKRR